MLRAPPGCTALRPRRTTGWADGHGTATAGGVESVTSVPRVDDGAVSTKFASPPSPTGSSGPPSADASTTSPSASRSDNTGCAVAAGAGAPSTDTATASGRTGPVPSGTSTISRTWPSTTPAGTTTSGGWAMAAGAPTRVDTTSSNAGTSSAAARVPLRRIPLRRRLPDRVGGHDDIVPVTPGCVVERAAAGHEPQ